jgi:V/A-type H+-transporting ATPase subunit C
LLSLYLDEVMSFTRSLVLDKELIDIFYYRNDLENLHTLCVTEEVRDEFFLKGKFTRAELIDIMRNKRLSSFPTYLREVVGKILTQPDYDYLFDLLGVYKKLSLEYKNEFLHYLFAEEEKIVKDKIAIVNRIASDDKIDVDMLLQEEYKKNFNHVVSFYKKYNSLAILDKIGDDILTSIYKMTKFTFFGVEPLIAYYWARRIEIINLRLIYLSKILNTPADFTSQLLRNSFLS